MRRLETGDRIGMIVGAAPDGTRQFAWLTITRYDASKDSHYGVDAEGNEYTVMPLMYGQTNPNTFDVGMWDWVDPVFEEHKA